MCARSDLFGVLNKHLRKYLNFLTMTEQTKISNKKKRKLAKTRYCEKKNELFDCYLKLVIVTIKK